MSPRKPLALLIAPLFVVGMAACDVERTQEGDLPDVRVEEGRIPAHEAEPHEFEDTLIVPDVEVRPEDEIPPGTP